MKLFFLIILTYYANLLHIVQCYQYDEVYNYIVSHEFAMFNAKRRLNVNKIVDEINFLYISL